MELERGSNSDVVKKLQVETDIFEGLVEVEAAEFALALSEGEQHHISLLSRIYTQWRKGF
jgi:hypothetical protein